MKKDGKYEGDCIMKEDMKVYITEIHKKNGKYEGPRIMAYSWLEAEGIANRVEGLILVGELAG